MSLFNKLTKPVVGFPSLDWDDVEETRPMGQHERPLQARIDTQVAVIGARHTRVALAIEKIWGHPECVTYMQDLVLSGYNDGEKRMGFKPEIVTALLTLVELHKQAFGLQGREDSRP